MTSSSSSLYPKIDQSNPDAIKITSSSSSSLYPSLDMKELSQNLFPDDNGQAPIATQPSVEETLVTIPGSIVHLIDDQDSVELASGDLTVVRLRQGDNVVAVLLRVGQDMIQWPLAKDEASVKLDQSHYFFSLRIPSNTEDDDAEIDNRLIFVNYGVTIASKGQEKLLKQFDQVLDKYSSFSVQKVVADKDGTVLDASDAAKAISPVELKSDENKELMKDTSAAYWTTLAPNVDDYSSCAARAIAAGSGSLIKGILWCGDVTANRLKWGNEYLTRNTAKCSKETQLSPATLRGIKRAKRITKMSEQVAKGILSGVVKVSGFFTSSVVNSKAGSKFFSLLPGEIVLASLDGFSRVFDAVEVAGKNVMSTTSTVTTGIVSHRYGEQAGGATSEGFGAAGHAIGTAWAVLKIRNAINPKNVVRPSSMAKTAAKAIAAQAKSKTISK